MTVSQCPDCYVGAQISKAQEEDHKPVLDPDAAAAQGSSWSRTDSGVQFEREIQSRGRSFRVSAL